jgi:hypothetical protein
MSAVIADATTKGATRKVEVKGAAPDQIFSEAETM